MFFLYTWYKGDLGTFLRSYFILTNIFAVACLYKGLFILVCSVSFLSLWQCRASSKCTTRPKLSLSPPAIKKSNHLFFFWILLEKARADPEWLKWHGRLMKPACLSLDRAASENLDISFTFMQLCLLSRVLLALKAQSLLSPSCLQTSRDRGRREEGGRGVMERVANEVWAKIMVGTREDCSEAQPWIWSEGGCGEESLSVEKLEDSESVVVQSADLHPPSETSAFCASFSAPRLPCCSGGVHLPSSPRGDGKKYPPISC